jgi:hypothetical protein
MGETPAERGKRLEKRQSITGLRFEEADEVLAASYRLTHVSELYDLLLHVFGLSCRDQEEDDDGALQKRRADGHRLAIEMRDNARAMITSLEAIHAAWTKFNVDVVRWHPQLLEAVFDVDTEGPENMFLPEQIEVLQTFFPAGYWEDVEARLQVLVDLPIRPKLKRGPVENVTLRRAVTACRAYWRDVEGRSWTMSSLKNAAGRAENKPEHLQGECELFVTDVLTACGVRYSLQELSSAWIALDRPRGAVSQDSERQ